MEKETKKIAKKLSNLIPLFTRRLMRPLERHTRNLTSPMHMHTLDILSEQESFTMTEISNEMHASKQQMTPIIDKLVDSGFVQRKHNDIDRRSINISLTPVGLEFLNNFNQEITAIVKGKIECLDKDDLIALDNALDDLFRIINKIPK